MLITFECDQCRRRYQVSDASAGKRSRCKQCGNILTVPDGPAPMVAELYELAADDRSSRPLDDEPPRPAKAKKKGKKTSSGLPVISSLPPWGFHVYRGVILTLLVLSLLVGGLPKLILALAGVFLCVGPFVASGFRYRFGVAFRDGPVAGVLYMLFTPYRIHYRLTHQELFRTLRAPTLTLRDFGLLLYGLLFLPVVILAAQEIDKQAKNRPPAVDWTRVAALVPKGNRAPEPPRQRHARPELPGPPKGAISRRHPTGPAAAEPVTEPEPTHPAADPAPAVPAPSRLAEADTVTDQPAAGGSEIDAPPRFGRAHRRPSMPFPPGQAAPPAYGPDETVTITVHGVPDFEASKRLNDAITAILKSSGSGWSLRSNTSGGKTTFIAAPVGDPQAFAGKIDFGKVTRVEGRSIEVDAGP